IGNQSTIKDKKVPRMVTTSSIHAREYTPAEISTRFAEWLIKNYGTDPTATWLLNNNEFHLILHANPDGRKLAEQAVEIGFWSGWRKNVNFVDAYCKTSDDKFLAQYVGPGSSGVDLNRNFPFGWNSSGERGSSSDSCDLTFRGKSAASEPETAAILKYVAGTRQQDGNFFGGVLQDRRAAAATDFSTGAPNDYEGLYIDIHSYSQQVVWPWGIQHGSLQDNSRTANDDGMSALGQRIAWYNGYRASQWLYDADGTTMDTFYGELGAPSFLIELGTSFYEPCDSFEKDTFPKNVASLRYAARTLKAPYQLPLGPDATDLKVSAATVKQGEPVTLTATIDDDRYLYDAGNSLNQAVTKHDPQPIKAANAYINVLPWDAGAKAIPLSVTASAAFGSGPKVTVSGVIDTSAFAPGKHLIYVQGINQKDKAGPPDAVFLEVLAKDAPLPCPPKSKAI
ncbi:MAG: M14 family zinc carboxypeptidase, partial [Variovorax sp.]|nr:M14 family zinc carboxypeptidase [Variovorax sp.]